MEVCIGFIGTVGRNSGLWKESMTEEVDVKEGLTTKSLKHKAIILLVLL